ncbi:DUF5658 family protein [Rhabdothermincola sp.]|uniref:DUF5658 family protein n=1 Tax=Rhabdothermincola sp. TaxID=2820405 RepID=UPI002FE1C087
MEAGSAIERAHRAYVAAAAVLVVLNVADVGLTRAAIEAGASELNPISRSFIEHGALAYAIKFAVPASVLLIALRRRARARIDVIHVAAIWTIVGIYLMVVFINAVTWAHLR